jgi:hypothetical protein
MEHVRDFLHRAFHEQAEEVSCLEPSCPEQRFHTWTLICDFGDHFRQGLLWQAMRDKDYESKSESSFGTAPAGW